jgi:hypothetical protein
MRSVPASLVCLMTAGLASNPASAKGIHHAQSGQPKVLGVYFNCTPRGGLPSPSGAAHNGTITTRVATANRCGNPHQPVVQMIYTSRPGFTGRDQAHFYGSPPRVTTIIVR